MEEKTGIIRGWAMGTNTEKGDDLGWGLTAMYLINLYTLDCLYKDWRRLGSAAGFIRRPGIYEWWSFLGYEIYPDLDWINENFDFKTNIDADLIPMRSLKLNWNLILN